MDLKAELENEYCRKIENRLLWILKVAGYFRFATKNGRIARKNDNIAILRCCIAVLLSISSASYVLYSIYFTVEFLMLSEVLIVGQLVLIQTLTLINIGFFNRNSGLKIIKYCMEVDAILGVRETKFMRDVADKAYVALTVFIASCQTVTVAVLYLAYDTPFSTHVVGSIFFALLFLIFYDVCFLITFGVFIALRVSYLNVSIIKKAHIRAEYFPTHYPFDGILWKKSYDNLVDFQIRGSSVDYIESFKCIFKLLKQLEKCYRFGIFTGMVTITVGTFTCVPVIILYDKSTDYNVLRMVCVLSWVILGWFYIYSSSQQTDLFCRQIDKTKLICTFIQLKPLISEEVLKITKDILHTLKIRETQISIYGISYFNTGLILRISASIFVYITVQLQLLMSPNKN